MSLAECCTICFIKRLLHDIDFGLLTTILSGQPFVIHFASFSPDSSTYFAPELRQRLIQQGKINLESYFYSQDLLKKVKGKEIKETAVSEQEYAVRDQGFKRTMRRIYDHRCALCGIRVKTAEEHTAVVGAHIIPWNINHNDDPRNGLSLCRLCHWTFDEGLMTVNLDYVVRTSPQLNSLGNMAAHLALLNQRNMIRPADSDFLPDPDSLSWHMKKVFRRR